MPMKKMLVTRPKYDEATSYSYYYAGIVIKEAGDKCIRVIDLRGRRLRRAVFEQIIGKESPSFLFFNAHGDEKTIYGDKIDGDEEFLVKEGENQGLLDCRLVYSRTCWSAASLGKTCKGGCFIGHCVPFSFWLDEKWSTNPNNDNVARQFFEPSNLIVSSLLKGNTAEEAVDKSKNLAKKTIMRLLNEKEEPGAMASVRLLWNNMEGTEIHGNRHMKFE